MDRVAAAIIGGGPGGLGVAGSLADLGVRCVLLERGSGVGEKWRRSYDRLKINTSTLTSHLPGQQFPRSVGLWASRDELVAYYEQYASSRQLDVRFGWNVTRVDHHDGAWVVIADEGEILADNVVVATGRDGSPTVPSWPGLDRFTGKVLHSSLYETPQTFIGQNVLVVGAGNSGSDIAVDLVDGAASVSVAIRTPPHLVRRSIAGVPSDVVQVLTRRLPDGLVSALAERIRRRTYGDLETLGLPRPDLGIRASNRAGKVPTIDSGPFADGVRRGDITIVGPLNELDPDRARVGAEWIEVDAIIAATGYKPNLAMIEHLGILTDDGHPDWGHEPVVPGHPGLYVTGFGDLTRGNLRGLRIDAKKVARAIGVGQHAPA